MLAALIDRLIPLLIVVVGGLVEFGTRASHCISEDPAYSLGPYCVTGNSVLGVAVWIITLLLAVAFSIWNFGYRQGTTGFSLGKQAMKVRLVNENTGRPIGFGTAVLRQLGHAADTLYCYVGYLFPLWDAKKQTLADKIVKSVCVRVAPEPPESTPAP